MRRQYVHEVWRADPTVYAPPRYRRACEYGAVVPEPVAGIDVVLPGDVAGVVLPGDVAGVVPDAARAIADLNRAAGPEVMSLARLLLRNESIASAKVEGMQADARSLARPEADEETGRRIGPGAAGILPRLEAGVSSTSRG